MKPHDPDDNQVAKLYRLQVREHEDVAMFLCDSQGHITSWNRGVEQVFGYQEGEWVGLHASVIFTPEDREAGIPEHEMRQAAESGRSSDIRWHIRRDGSRVYVTGVMRALRDVDGELIGYSKIAIDDTARKRLEDALTQSNMDLQQFAFIASHDMQEPLRTVRSFAELLERNHASRLDDQGRELLSVISRSAQRMSVLIDDLLRFSQVADAEVHAGSVHLDADLEAALSLLRTAIEETNAVVTHDALPYVEANRGDMVRLFQNLIGNAIKFRKPEEAPRIHVSVERLETEWLVRVEDNGMGFEPEQSENIFAPFRRLNASKQYPGTGLGLSACKRIVERYGGRIGAESEPGRGSVFWFTLPVVEGAL